MAPPSPFHVPPELQGNAEISDRGFAMLLARIESNERAVIELGHDIKQGIMQSAKMQMRIMVIMTIVNAVTMAAMAGASVYFKAFGIVAGS